MPTKTKTPTKTEQSREMEAETVKTETQGEPAPEKGEEKEPAPEKEKKKESPPPASFLPKKRTGVKTSFEQLTILAYGLPKIGKSTFCSMFPDALFLPTEPGLNHLEVFQAPPDGTGVKSWTEFLSICREIKKGQHNFKTIVIDTVDNLWKLCEQHVCKSRSIDHVSDLAMGKGYGLVANEFERCLRYLIQLPYGVVMTSHAKDLEKEGTVSKTVPTLTGGARKIIVGISDMVLFFDVQKKTVEEGEAPKWLRVIRTKPTARYDAGDRSGTLPAMLDLHNGDPAAGFAEFSEAYANGVAEKKKKQGKPAASK